MTLSCFLGGTWHMLNIAYISSELGGNNDKYFNFWIDFVCHTQAYIVNWVNNGTKMFKYYCETNPF